MISSRQWGIGGGGEVLDDIEQAMGIGGGGEVLDDIEQAMGIGGGAGSRWYRAGNGDSWGGAGYLVSVLGLISVCDISQARGGGQVAEQAGGQVG